MWAAIWNDEQLMRILAGLFGAISAVLLGYACIQWFIHRPVFELRQVELTGEVDRVNLIGFKANVLPKVSGSFFSANLHDIRKTVESQPWVRKAVVQRTWPNGLTVNIQSHKPLALWGDTRLINTFGEVFSANLAEVSEDHEMATLNGPNGSEKLVAKTYVFAAQHLRELGMQAQRVELSDRYGWSFVTDAGMCIELGREQEGFGVAQKLKRLITVYPKINKQLFTKIQQIDLRYPRAVAVKGERLAEQSSGKAAGTRLN